MVCISRSEPSGGTPPLADLRQAVQDSRYQELPSTEWVDPKEADAPLEQLGDGSPWILAHRPDGPVKMRAEGDIVQAVAEEVQAGFAGKTVKDDLDGFNPRGVPGLGSGHGRFHTLDDYSPTSSWRYL